jgi:hypothetical protein
VRVATLTDDVKLDVVLVISAAALVIAGEMEEPVGQSLGQAESVMELEELVKPASTALLEVVELMLVSDTVIGQSLGQTESVMELEELVKSASTALLEVVELMPVSGTLKFPYCRR